VNRWIASTPRPRRRKLFDVLEERAEHVPVPLDHHMMWQHRIPLAVHSRASLDEILAAFSRMTFERRNRLRQGVDFDPATLEATCSL
jgi:hypothetical protein